MTQGVTRLDNFTLTVDRGEIVGVAGVEGNGQSELAAVLAGMATPSDGQSISANVEDHASRPKEITAAGVGIVPEDRHAVGCVLGMSVAENIYLNRLDEFTRFGFLRRKDLIEGGARADGALRRARRGPGCAFSASPAATSRRRCWRARSRCRICRSWSRRSRRAASMSARWPRSTATSARPAQRGVAVLLVSSELDELLTVADRIVVLYRGRIMGTCAADPANASAIGAMMAGQAQ